MSRENFLERWSRLKRQPAPAKAEVYEVPEGLPPLDSLTFESDFRTFMHARVDECVRRAALKKLFADPRFNVMDGLDVYIDDYSKEDPIPAVMLAGLQHAKNALLGTPAEEGRKPEERTATPTALASSDEPPETLSNRSPRT